MADSIEIDPVADEAHPVASFGVRAGLPGLRWDAAAGYYRAGVGHHFDLGVQGPGYDPDVASLTFGPPGAEQPEGRRHPLTEALVPYRAGPMEVRFNTASGQQLVIPVLVEGPLVRSVGPLRTLGSSQDEQGFWSPRTYSDDAVGVILLPDGRRAYLFSTNAGVGEITTWVGTPDNLRESGGWSAVIEGAPRGICNGGQAVADHETGAWLMVTLNQLYPADPTPGVDYGAGYGFEGLAVSADQGRSWRWRGPVSGNPVTAETYFASPDDYGVYIAGGGGLLFVGDSDGNGIGYVECHSACVMGPCRGERGRPGNFASVTRTRAPWRELVDTALRGEDCRHLWRGWHDGGWNSPFDGPRSPIAPWGGNGGAKLFWVASRGVWGAVFHGIGSWRSVYFSWAPTRLGPWSPPEELFSVYDLPNAWPYTIWGAPMVLESGGVVCQDRDWFDVGIVAYDGIDPPRGTGEVRLVAARVRIRP